MNTNLLTQAFDGYALIDSGNGYLLEQFGPLIIQRPFGDCLWQQNSPHLWEKAHAACVSGEDKFEWAISKKLPKLLMQYTMPKDTDLFAKHIQINMRLNKGSKNIGIFPEQAAHWDLIAKACAGRDNAKVLNLFGYTGISTLVAAAAGATVTHVDASKSAITWARENQNQSDLGNREIRWIVDDCLTFVKRELKRGVRYDAIILDPPAFGRDPKGKVFTFETQIRELLDVCARLLSDNPLFFILNGYALGHSSIVLKQLLDDALGKQKVEHGELMLLQQDRKRQISCSVYARVSW